MTRKEITKLKKGNKIVVINHISHITPPTYKVYTFDKCTPKGTKVYISNNGLRGMDILLRKELVNILPATEENLELAYKCELISKLKNLYDFSFHVITGHRNELSIYDIPLEKLRALEQAYSEIKNIFKGE